MIESSCEIDTAAGKAVVPFRLRRSARNRYLRVSVRDTGEVILSVPASVSDAGALDFMRSQAEWLVRTLGRLPPRRRDIEEHLRAEPWLSLDGSRAHVMLDQSRLRTHWVADPKREEAIIRCVKDAQNSDDELAKALLEMARQFVPTRARQLAERHGLSIGSVRIRNQRTLWGSCTGDGNLSINWRIILLPPELHDHILLHELAHLTHMNHSRAFYAVLRRYDPDADRNDHRISKLSPIFMAMGR
ncbi:MAG TPA: SprT family zinc-dependent metalloprotease [Opitutales bacterium]|nr:SprT family zinc-dependent metalloprotease [Opitutales bacterium]